VERSKLAEPRASLACPGDAKKGGKGELGVKLDTYRDHGVYLRGRASRPWYAPSNPFLLHATVLYCTVQCQLLWSWRRTATTGCS